MKERLIKFLNNINELESLDLEKLLSKPKVAEHGDFCIPMFVIAKNLGKDPAEVAKEFEKILIDKIPDFLSEITAIGPFLNFKVNNFMEAKNILKNILNDNFLKVKKNQKILIEYPSPNTNKALHIGHSRNILLGNSLGKILEFCGHKVIRTNLNNDRGIAICKAMLGFEKYFSNKTPESENIKSDQFVANCYVKFESENKLNPELEQEALEMLKKWEEKDEKTIALWNKILNWVYNGYKVTYKNYKLPKFDYEFRESDIFDKGKDIVLNALENKVKGFMRDETGAVLVDFENETLGKKYLLRKDGTTLYMTQDLFLAEEKEKLFSADKNVFIVAHEQAYHFEVLFEILNRLGFGGNDKNFHFAYGMIYDKDGNKFSSRKGNAINADELYDLVIENAKNNLIEKSPELSEEELNRRSKIIGYGALTFSMLKVNPLSNINFDIEKALATTGETGPYTQYTYARIKSILRKASYNLNEIDYNKFSDKEMNLIKILGEFNFVVEEAANKYKISAIANYLIKLCQAFNEFYQSEKVIGSENEQEKLFAIDMTSKIIKLGLELLDIEVLEEM